MIAQASLSTGVPGSTAAAPRITNSGGRALMSVSQQGIDAGGVGLDQRASDLGRRALPTAPPPRDARRARAGTGRCRAPPAPKASASRPAPMRRCVSSCHSRSCACTKPRPNIASSAEAALDRRNAVRVALDAHLGAEAVDRQRAVGARQRRSSVEPGERRHGDQQQRQQQQTQPPHPFHAASVAAARRGGHRGRGRPGLLPREDLPERPAAQLALSASLRPRAMNIAPTRALQPGHRSPP